jgi:hypothetical protein
MTRLTAAFAAALLVAGCATTAPPLVMYPTDGQNEAEQAADMAACQAEAERLGGLAPLPGHRAALAVGVGSAVAGAVLGAIAGAFLGAADDGAMLGAWLGTVGASLCGAVTEPARLQQARASHTATCMRSRGYYTDAETAR